MLVRFLREFDVSPCCKLLAPPVLIPIELSLLTHITFLAGAPGYQASSFAKYISYQVVGTFIILIVYAWFARSHSTPKLLGSHISTNYTSAIFSICIELVGLGEQVEVICVR